MIKRTTIEIDVDLLERARRALDESTARATVHEALKRIVEDTETERERRRSGQLRYFDRLMAHGDASVLSTEEMWR